MGRNRKTKNLTTLTNQPQIQPRLHNIGNDSQLFIAQQKHPQITNTILKDYTKKKYNKQ